MTNARLLLVFALAAIPLVRAESGPAVDLKPCSIKDVDGEIGCGSYEVFEHRQSASGRRIHLKIVILRASNVESQPDPLLILAGGPGQAATANASFFAKTFAQVRRARDIVLVDLRGTGGSSGLECDLYGDTTQAHLKELFPIHAIRQCAKKWQANADLRYYTTEIAMTDLDELRASLGYERWNLFGTSYGTRAAQVYMRQFPERVRAVIMKGVTPMSVALTMPMAVDAQRAWDLLCDDCAADPICQAAFPRLKEDFRTVFARLEKELETEIEVAKEKKEKVKISRAAIAPTIRTLLQSIDSSAELPWLIHQAAEGNYQPIAQAALKVRRGFPKAVSVGFFLTVSSIEDVAITDPKEVERVSAGTFLRDDYFKQQQRAAAVLPHKEMPNGYREPVQSDIPTLLISGFVDPATPPSGADEVGKRLPKSKHVVARYGSHSYGGMSPCVDRIMAEFIARGSAEGLDTSCVEQIRRPPFVTSERAKSSTN